MSTHWGKAKTAVAVLSEEIKRRIESGETAAAVYDSLVTEGRAEGFSRSSFFRWVQPKAKSSSVSPTTGTAKRTLPVTVKQHKAASPAHSPATIQPATPVTGTKIGSVLLGEDDDGTD